MGNLELPLWEQMASPTNSKAELTELRNLLSSNDKFSDVLQRFLFSEYLSVHAYARMERNPELKGEYLAYANSLGDLAKKLFETPKQTKPTTKMPKV